MIIIIKKTSALCFGLLGLIISILLLSGCDKADEGKPQIADINSVGCLIANDFYAVHFSAYLQPTTEQQNDPKAREALLKPYCQELPNTGKTFFSADLIDRDVRKTPIGIRLVELDRSQDKGEKPVNYHEVATLLEVPPKLYPRGVVEAQADISKVGDYALILIIGGEEAISDDDKLHIPFHVGKKLFELSTQMLFLLAVGLLLIVVVAFFILRRNKVRSE